MSTCDLEDTLTVYLGYGNTVLISADYSAVDVDTISEVEFCIQGITVSSEDIPPLVEWDVDKVRVRPGMVAGIVAGETTASVIIYDDDHTDGQVVAHGIPINIIEVC